MASLDTIFFRLTTAYNALALGPNTDPKAKIQLRKAALELVAATQTPEEAAMLFATSNGVFPCYRVAADCGIFAALAEKEEEGGLSAKELAGRTGADERLVGAFVILLFGEVRLKLHGSVRSLVFPTWDVSETKLPTSCEVLRCCSRYPIKKYANCQS